MLNTKKEHLIQPSGKGWLSKIKTGLKVAGTAASVLLSAPLKLPGKLLKIAQYLALVAGIVKATEQERVEQDE